MSTLSSVVIDGIEYSVIVVEGTVVGFRRYHAFNRKKGMWVELRFSLDEQSDSDVGSELISNLIEVALTQMAG